MSEKLWIPSLIFPQSEGNIILNVDESSFMFVERNGSGTVSGSEYTDESLVYKGQENWILFVKKLQLKHQCHFNFAHYPFDTQKCHIKVWKCKIYFYLTNTCMHCVLCLLLQSATSSRISGRRSPSNFEYLGLPIPGH